MQHSVPLLRLANVCHPEVDPGVRRRVMFEVAVDENLERWIRRLEHRDDASVAMAMHMLGILERRTDYLEGFCDEPPDNGPPILPFLALFLLLLAVVCVWQKIDNVLNR